MLSVLRRRAMLKGPLGGSRQWTLLWAALVGMRLVKRLARPKPDVVLTEAIRPGETLVLTGVDREARVLGGG